MNRRSNVLTTPKRKRPRGHVNPFGLYGVVFAVLTLAPFAALLWRHVLPGMLFDWLLPINVTAIIAYSYDKAISSRRVTRVPENVLLGIALLGGSPAALLTMRLVHHKTAKRSFLARMALVLLLQVGFVAAYVFLVRR